MLLEINLNKAIHFPGNHCDIIILVFNDVKILMLQIFKMTHDVGTLSEKVVARGEKTGRICVKGDVARGSSSLYDDGVQDISILKNTTFSYFSHLT